MNDDICILAFLMKACRACTCRAERRVGLMSAFGCWLPCSAYGGSFPGAEHKAPHVRCGPVYWPVYTKAVDLYVVRCGVPGSSPGAVVLFVSCAAGVVASFPVMVD